MCSPMNPSRVFSLNFSKCSLLFRSSGREEFQSFADDQSIQICHIDSEVKNLIKLLLLLLLILTNCTFILQGDLINMRPKKVSSYVLACHKLTFY